MAKDCRGKGWPVNCFPGCLMEDLIDVKGNCVMVWKAMYVEVSETEERREKYNKSTDHGHRAHRICLTECEQSAGSWR